MMDDRSDRTDELAIVEDLARGSRSGGEVDDRAATLAAATAALLHASRVEVVRGGKIMARHVAEDAEGPPLGQPRGVTVTLADGRPAVLRIEGVPPLTTRQRGMVGLLASIAALHGTQDVESDGSAELLNAAVELGATLDPKELHEQALTMLVPRLGSWAAVYIVKGDEVVRVASRSARGTLSVSSTSIAGHRDEGSPLHAALRTRRREVLRGVPGPVLRTVHPDIDIVDEMLAAAPDDQRVTLGYLPLVTEDRAVLGVIALRVGRDPDASLDVAEHMATVLARSLGQAYAFARERQLAQALRTAVVQEELPTVEGWEMAVESRPADGPEAIGGDWWDVVPLPDGRFGVAVGDVVGHGLEVATTMAQVRNLLRAWLFEGLAPSRAVGLLNSAMMTLMPGQLATLIVGVLDVHLGTFDHARAGHPPPIITGRQAAVGQDRPGPMLGAVRDHEYTQRRVVILPGQVLLLYTDGLVEQPGQPLDVAVDALAARARAWPAAQASDLCATLANELRLDPDRHDDACVLAIGREPQQANELVEWLPPRADSIPPVRERLRYWLRSIGVEEDTVVDAELILSELAANAIAATIGPHGIGLAVAVDDHRVTIAVSNEGEPFTPPDPRAADPLGLGGRGLRVVGAAADRVDIGHEDGTTTVSCALIRSAHDDDAGDGPAAEGDPGASAEDGPAADAAGDDPG